MARARLLLFSVMVVGVLHLLGTESFARAEVLSVEITREEEQPRNGAQEWVNTAAAPVRRSLERRVAQEQVPVRKALDEALSKLSDLSPEQQRLFKEEVLPRARSFVTHVHAGAEGKVRVDIDLAAIRGYLALKAPRILNGKGLPKVLLAVQSSSDCTGCVSAEPGVFQAFQGRMKRRGFEVETLEFEGGVATFSLPYLREKMSEAGAQGAAGIRIARKGLESVDTAHLEDQGYQLELVWAFPGGSTPIETTEKFETLPGEGILEGLDRGLTATLIRLGGSLAQGQGLVGSEEQGKRKGRPQIRLRVEGFRNYADFLAVRSQLQAWGAGELQFREHRFDAGKAWFLVTLALMQPGEEISDPAALGEAIAEKFRKKSAKLGNPVGLEPAWDSTASELLVKAHQVEEAASESPASTPADSEAVSSGGAREEGGAGRKKGGTR